MSKEYFDEVARDWDEMRSGFFTERIRVTAFEIAGIQPGELAVDLGAGTGYLTEGLIERGLRVIAIDQSQEMLAEFTRKFAGNESVEFRLGESESLPIQDQAVDYVFANMYLHHVESPLDSIKEMARILRPGGVVVITDMDAHNHEFLRIEQHDRWLGFERDDLKAWLTAAGLGDVKVDCAGDTCSADSTESDDTARITIFAASGRKRQTAT